MRPKSLGLSIALLAGFATIVEGQGKVEIDNPWVRVLRIQAGPHEKIPMHEHPASVVVCLTDIHERVTEPGGRTQEVTRKADDVVYRDPTNHAEENLSDQPLEAIVVELKPDAPKAQSAPTTAPDPVEADPTHHQVPIDNDRVRVLRTTLEPHLRGPMHRHRSYVVVYLTGLHTTMKLADGRTVDNPRKPGEVAFRNAYQHQTENIGDKTAVEIQIELK
jgi:quercetin dioxygenase-like cupin family protein